MEAIRVAIADDNERILELLDEIIRSDNELKLVGKADNGEDICTIIREKEPDVVLLDLIMPKMDGLSVMDQINHDRKIRRRPNFIVVTAVGQDRITESAFSKGAQYYVMKPFKNEVLLHHIKDTVKGKHAPVTAKTETVMESREMTEEDWNSGTHQRLSLFERCHHYGGRGYGCVKRSDKSAVSDGG